MIKTLEVNGKFYTYSKLKNNYSDEMRGCIERTVQKLQDVTTTKDHPGMLLGKIQSGKTRTFLGVMSLGYDNGYDAVIILTKGTRALAQQTIERLKVEFHDLEKEDLIQIFDIMLLPKNLTRYELDQKLVFVVKKEAKNMVRLHEAFFKLYPSLAEKNILIIDDEADFASIGFEGKKDEDPEIKKIAGQIDSFRQKAQSSFLQVTATPYSLYLQPENITIKEAIFMPVKPAFTELVPIHDKYVGGDVYFRESEDEDSVAYSLFIEVPPEELQVLKKQDRRVFKIEECLYSKKIQSLRNSIVNFIAGGCIRRIQDRTQGLPLKKYSFIIHTEQNKSAHEWQEQIIQTIIEKLVEEADNKSDLLNELVKEAYSNLSKSIQVAQLQLPSLEEVVREVQQALEQGHIMITKVNSEKDVNELLDQTGQLKLRTPLNIFIGGQILDRGITIGNLIGFYYGRRPKTFQQDTVLQHSRMYGARPMEDLAVTRFYTTTHIFEVMGRIHEFDSALREAFEKGSHQNGVVFIQKDSHNEIIPCSPNKIYMAETTTLKPGSRSLPVGFEVRAKTHLQKPVAEIDSILSEYHKNWNNTKDTIEMDVNDVVTIIEHIASTFAEGHSWNHKAFIASIEYLSSITSDPSKKGKVLAIVRTNREVSRLKKKDGRIENSPDSYQEKNLAKDCAVDIPAIMLLRQSGMAEGWTGGPFYWPVLVVQKKVQTVIFANRIVVD